LIELNCGAVLGKKRALLLEGIDLFRSIGGAAEAAGIPLDHALELVSSMNDSCRSPLVEILNAEVADISAWLTVAGQRAVQDFKPLYKDLKLSLLRS
jgi:molybdate transport repressor ModE-like protein